MEAAEKAAKEAKEKQQINQEKTPDVKKPDEEEKQATGKSSPSERAIQFKTANIQKKIKAKNPLDFIRKNEQQKFEPYKDGDVTDRPEGDKTQNDLSLNADDSYRISDQK